MGEKQTHSPEPWAWHRDWSQISIEDADDQSLLPGDGWINVDLTDRLKQIEADMRRIAACVNILKGWKTEQLEEMAAMPPESLASQARAWQRVCNKLWHMGMASFLPDCKDDLQRAMEFLDTVARELNCPKP